MFTVSFHRPHQKPFRAPSANIKSHSSHMNKQTTPIHLTVPHIRSHPSTWQIHDTNPRTVHPSVRTMFPFITRCITPRVCVALLTEER